MKAHTLAITLTVILMALTGAFADVPNQINYQGTLTDSSGNPITGTESMQFALFDTSTGGLSLWSETQATVDIADGLFRVLLGSVTTLPGSIFSGQDLWLETTIGAETLTPRTPFGTVA